MNINFLVGKIAVIFTDPSGDREFAGALEALKAPSLAESQSGIDPYKEGGRRRAFCLVSKILRGFNHGKKRKQGD